MSDPVDDQIAAHHGQQEAATAAAQLCFEDCAAGLHLDPENGVMSVCKNWTDCEGWRAYLHIANRLCDDCPPVGYPTDKTRCSECPRHKKEAS